MMQNAQHVSPECEIFASSASSAQVKQISTRAEHSRDVFSREAISEKLIDIRLNQKIEEGIIVAVCRHPEIYDRSGA